MASVWRRTWPTRCPPVDVDREQFKRVVVNLVDNAAEAMQESLVKRLYIGTRLTEADSVELIIADTGCGVSREDKEKLFLPYFSTKGRGTGLGLAIVNRILADHEATIRVEDNLPAGARFVVDLPVQAGADPEPKRPKCPPRRSVREAGADSDRRRRASDPPVAGRRAGRRRLSDPRGRDRRGMLRRGRTRALRSGPARCVAARHGWPRDVVAGCRRSLSEPPRGGDYFRAWNYRDRGQSHQAGRIRFSGEAAHHRKSDGGGEERAPAAQARNGSGAPEGRRAARISRSSAKASR